MIAHRAGLMGTNIKVTLEIEAEIPDGAPDHVVPKLLKTVEP